MILLLGPQYGSDVSRMAINKMRKMVGYDFHYMRKKYRVLACRALFARGGGFLQQHVEATGPGWYSVEKQVRKESSRASMTRSEKKSMLLRYSFLEANKKYQAAE